jgi:hypothetical protein
MDSQPLLGSDLTPEEVAEYRSLRRERLLVNEERLIERRERLRILPTDGVDEECSVAGGMGIFWWTRGYERKPRSPGTEAEKYYGF